MMTVDTLLCFCFFLSLQVTGAPAADAEKQMRGAAGEDFSGACGVSFSGAWKIFCRENCEGGNILIKTRANAAKTGRYSIEYVKDSGSDVYVLWVKISELNRSDSGRYRCGLGQSLSSVSYQEFTLVVPEASTSRPATSQRFSSSSGSSTPSVSSGTTGQSVLTQENSATSQCTSSHCSSSQTSADVWLFVFPALAITVALLFVTLMVFCRKRSKKRQTASPEETEQTPASETTRLDEEGREEDERWRSADVEIYLAYIAAISSSAAAATDQRQAPGDDADAAEGKFSRRNWSSPVRADMSDVLYSVPGSHGPRQDELLYSNVF